MHTAVVTAVREPAAAWSDVLWPKEHGSWSLALEPVALGLLLSPSPAGALFAVAVIAGFFARRPLRLAVSEKRAGRRAVALRVTLACAAIAAAATTGALAVSGSAAWLGWLLSTLLAGGVFLFFDLQQSGRDQAAEVAGSVAFAWLPAVFAILGHAAPATAAIAGTVMLVRSLPTVLTVRATIRARKTGERSVVLPLGASLAGAVALGVLFARGMLPLTIALCAAALALRSFALLVFPRPSLRASTIGMIEAALGVAFVMATVVSWHRFY